MKWDQNISLVKAQEGQGGAVFLDHASHALLRLVSSGKITDTFLSQTLPNTAGSHEDIFGICKPLLSLKIIRKIFIKSSQVK